MRALKIALITIVAAVLLIVAAAAVLFATLSDDSYRRLASYLFERATGRTLIVDGRFAVHPSLRPSIVVSHVRIPNPAWASTPEFAQIGHMEIEVALPSLLSGALVVQRLILEDASFALERRADGTANWTMGQGGSGPGLVPVLGTVRLRNVAWHYRDDASGDDTAVQLAHLTLEDTGAGGQLDAQGLWDGQAITAQGTLGTLAEALQPTSPFPLDLAVSLPGLALDLRGTIAEPAAGRGLDLRLAGRSDDIRPFLERLDSKAPLAGPAEGEATLRGDFDAVQIPDLRLTVGDPAAVSVKGAIATVRPGAARPLDGIALELAGSTTMAGLAAWLDRPLPDFGPIAGQLKLSGTSEALNVTGLKFQAGAPDGPTLGVSGDIAHIQLAPAFAVRGADLQLAAAAPDLAALGTMLDVSLPPRPLAYTGRLSGASDRWTLSGEAQLGDTAITHNFAGSITGTPPRLAGELSAALAGLELTARGTVADLITGQGLDLHVVGHADDVAPLLRLFGSEAPLRGRLAAQAALGGNLEALQVTGLRVSLDHGDKFHAAGDGPDRQRYPGWRDAPRWHRAPGAGDNCRGGARRLAGAPAAGSRPDPRPVHAERLVPERSRSRICNFRRARRSTCASPRPAASGRSGWAGPDGPEGRPQSRRQGAGRRRSSALCWTPTSRGFGALAYTGRLSGERALWRLAGKARVGRTVIDQDLAVEHERARPRVSGKLSIPTLYLADFGFGSEGAQSERGALPSLAAMLGGLDAVDLALHVQLGQVEGTRLPIGRGEMDLTLEDGVLRIDPARFGFVAGTTLVHASANARAQPPHTDLNVNADDVQLGEVVTAMGGTPPLTGELALLLKLQSSGDLGRGAAVVAGRRGPLRDPARRRRPERESRHRGPRDLAAGRRRPGNEDAARQGRTDQAQMPGWHLHHQARHRHGPVAADDHAADAVHGHGDGQSGRPDDRSGGAFPGAPGGHVRPRHDLPDPRTDGRSGLRFQQNRVYRARDRGPGHETFGRAGRAVAAGVR